VTSPSKLILAPADANDRSPMVTRRDGRRSSELDLDLGPFDLKIALPVTPEVDKLFSKFERCTVFHFGVNGSHGTDRSTDGRTDDGRTRCNA